MEGDEVVTSTPAQAEEIRVENNSAVPAPQADVSDAASDPALEAQRREEERAKARENAAFAELRRKEREAREEAQRERAERERERAERVELQRRLLSGGAQADPNASEGPPDPSRFAGGEFNPDYVRQLARFEAKQEAKQAFQAAQEAMTKRQQEQAQAQARQAAMQSWEKSVTEARGKYSDWEVIVESGGSDVPQQAKILLAGLPDGAELFYQVAKDPEKAKALTGSPVEIAAALGELRAEARYAAKEAAAKAAAEDAQNEPIKPGNASGRSGAEPDPADTERWIAWRRKERARQGMR